MRRTEVLQGLRRMKFEDVYGRWQRACVHAGASVNFVLPFAREDIDAAIARVLEERSAVDAGVLPEVVAYHCTEAGLAERAVGHWWRAAQLAVRRSATLEAIAHLENGADARS